MVPPPQPPTAMAAGLPTRLNASWLTAAPLTRVFAAFEGTGEDVRVVGGAVRNALLGQPITDIDLATTATPEQVVTLAGSAGLAVYPTGLAHGTMTVMADGQSFEITTLRRDLATDGRHATVAFTRDWAEDASRRDFTINALYVAADGTLTDTVGGLADLAAGRVRFIGDAATRIREDYLRILRFFRFSAQYGAGALDATGLAACAALKDGLARLSAERVGAELKKLIVAPRAAGAIAAMADAGILSAVLGQPGAPERLQRLIAIEQTLHDRPDAMTRLAVIAACDEPAARALAQRLRLSSAEADALAAAFSNTSEVAAAIGHDAAARALLYRRGPADFQRSVRVAWANSAAATDDAAWQRLARLPDTWRAPRLPISGADILARGVAPGPRVGALLNAFENWWIGKDFPSDSALHQRQIAHLIEHG